MYKYIDIIFFANIVYISSVFGFKNICRLLLPSLPSSTLRFLTHLGVMVVVGVSYVYISHPLPPPILHVSLYWCFLIYITHHI